MQEMGTEANERICPECKKPVDPREGVYRVRDADYHRECFEKKIDRDPAEGGGV